ncbi:NADH dehydrogenase subunit [Stereum hirsutum FP-91666 SS1]|uniref:NADH dehydrogenase subunit n=1 Tax=Stereum hirsutum (strain FP-91666) TaxID=721885 RepID=UPI0004449809|nr:NADH dehydrogenase subunit [Stereum hirsutum FP-91666 SS1]EIM81167.1 NADH dehydrogenase subunit [Stereum hirsutum FP-91666 SS1]
MAATKKAADHTLYHLAPRGFWKKFRDATVVNPDISSGLPLAAVNRRPQPASRPEKYSTPATKASDPAQNPYWKRDVRRAYPQLSVVTQSELSTLLIQHSSAPAYVYHIKFILPPRMLTQLAPSETKEGDASVPATAPKPVELTEAIATISSAAKAYSASKLPPSLPTPNKRWIPELAPDAPHDPNAYFPMILVK